MIEALEDLLGWDPHHLPNYEGSSICMSVLARLRGCRVCDRRCDETRSATIDSLRSVVRFGSLYPRDGDRRTEMLALGRLWGRRAHDWRWDRARSNTIEEMEESPILNHPGEVGGDCAWKISTRSESPDDLQDA